MNIFLSKKQDIADEIQGIKVSDPYRWLENADDPEVKKWIDIQNARVDETLKNGHFETFSHELAKNFKYISVSNPVPVKGRYFYTERRPDEEQPVLCVKNGLNGELVKLFDPNGKEKGNTISIDYWFESRSGKYIAYGISKDGDEMATLHIKNVDTNEELAEKIARCRHSSVRWLPDDAAFFYIRNPRPGTVPKNEEHLHSKVYLHMLGDDPENDKLIFGEGRLKDEMLGMAISLDGKYLCIQVSLAWTENKIYIYDCDKKETRQLFAGEHSKFSLYFLEGKVLLITNYKANNNRVLSAKYENLYQPLDTWKEFIPEREFLLVSLSATKSKILAEYLVNVSSEVLLFNYQGKQTGEIPLPQYSNLAGISAKRDEEEFFYGVNSFISPKIIYRYDPEPSAYSEYQKTDNPINPEEYAVKQEWFTSKDGTQVPLYIFHKKDIVMNGMNPTVLYGYGGFGISKTPFFMRNWVPWTERGGIFALANIRGGGEFGEKWHKGGIRENKQNSFDDFLAAAEHLIVKKYTSKHHLGILGGSNGGLLASVVGIQHPDLFSAVCAQVPLTDMVRFPEFGIAARWIHEYGNPKIKDDLEKILAWSPYHNVKKGIQYPEFLFTTADKDTRVDPLHARKMAAMLQGANDKNHVFVFTDTKAGHGAGKPVLKIVESQALVLNFFAAKLGLKV